MASLQGNCTSSNTTRQARHASLAWSLYIVRTSNIAKNRHKHRFASGTVSKNRHLYRIRCDTFGPALARKTPSPGDRRLSTYSFDTFRPNPAKTLICLDRKPRRSPIHVWPASILSCSGLSIYLWGERSLNPLPDEASRTKREKLPMQEFF